MAKSKRKRSARRFALGMLIYALVFIVFLAAGLRMFWVYIANYENSMPNHTMDSYIAAFDREHIRSLASPFVATLDHNLKSEEESYAVIEKLFDGDLHYSKNSAASTDDRIEYAIVCGGRILGTMALNRVEDGGKVKWLVSDESFDFSGLLSSAEITVPSDWEVSCGGNVLGDEYIVERGIRYPSLDQAYDFGIDLPYLVRYSVDNYIGDMEFTVKDWSGNVTEVPEDIGALPISDRCTPEERERMEDFARRFLPLYIAFMSNSNHNAYDNYARVKPYLLPGSDLERRFYGAIEGQTWSHSYGDVLHDVVCNGVIDLGDGTFLIDMDYMVDTTGNAGTVTSSAGVYIVAVDHGKDGIFATSLYVK